MKVLVTGAGGQLGRALVESAPEEMQIIGVTRAELDISEAEAVTQKTRETAPNLIINAAAYTAVDKAEGEEPIAAAINGDAVAHLAKAAQENGAKLVHISTDFVFDGTASTPYSVDAPTNPLNVYGRTKLAGEQAAQEILGEDALIVRTSWVYSSDGGNFVKTMLRLMREREELGIVADQIGTPTWAAGLANTIWSLAQKSAQGIYHHSDSGAASWYDFAVAIMEEGVALGLLDKPITIKPIATSDYPTPAQRPAYSVLDKCKTTSLLGSTPPRWRDNLRKMLAELKDKNG